MHEKSMIAALGRHGCDADMPPAKRKPRRRSSSRRSRRAGAFSFGSFIGGVVVGGAVVLAITYRSESTSTGGASPDTAPVAGPVASNIDFEFIRILPETEVETGVDPVGQPPPTDSGPKEYVLHAAQFLREEDAQVMLAELMLDGLPVSLTSNPRNQGGAWYQVMVGPYATQADAKGALNQLLDRDIPAQLLARPLTGATPAT